MGEEFSASRRRLLAGLMIVLPACPMCEAAAYWADIERLVSGENACDGGSPRLCG